ncbi:zinc metalloproteinase nas-31-like [Tigriopus californicus]|uniref:zinc metalloproteinase nas-31-like n=1 Tax=Tigriopus californicus TaxID=6832 RepID=UPI0027D9E7B8|nr:zinc metalloproteinase nas-31-like [Tigriopus californicus]
MKNIRDRWLTDGLVWIIMVWISIHFPPSFLGRRPRGRLKKRKKGNTSPFPFQWSRWLALLLFFAQGFSPLSALQQFYGFPSSHGRHNSYGSPQWSPFRTSRPAKFNTPTSHQPLWAPNHQSHWPGSRQIIQTPMASRNALWLPKTTSHSKASNHQFSSSWLEWNNPKAQGSNWQTSSKKEHQQRQHHHHHQQQQQQQQQRQQQTPPLPTQQWSHNLGLTPVRFQGGDNDDINAIQLLGEPDKVKGKGHLHHLSNINSNQTLEHGISLVHTKPEREMRTLIVEGDIATDIEENLFRLGIRWDLYPKKRWQNNTIPYKLSQEYGTREVTMIESALKTFQFLSCLRFEAYNGTQTDYLYIHQSKTRPGCWSYVGRRGGRQDLSLRPPDSTSCHCLCDVGRTLHEVMHALGFYHEHSRPDRDQFIHILSTNVRKGKLSNFRKKTFDTTTADFDYDYDSIMHYGPYFFSKSKKSRKVTIEPTKFGAKIGQRVMLSKIDCMKINQQFECFDAQDHWNNQRIQILCGMLGYSFK